MSRDFELGRNVSEQNLKCMFEGSSAWDDEELQTDILLATGVDLRRKDKRKRVSRKANSALTDISRIHKNTARKRLASKIFNKSVFRDNFFPDAMLVHYMLSLCVCLSVRPLQVRVQPRWLYLGSHKHI